MRNVKNEFLEETKGKSVLCAKIKFRGYDFILPIGYTESRFVLFLQSLEFEYYEGFGAQELYGTIWYKDGTWSERYEYDGSECWKYKSCPPIPRKLIH